MRYVATIDGAEHELDVEELGAAGAYNVRIGERELKADLRQVGPSSFSIIVGARSFDFDVIREGDELVVASRAGVSRMTLQDAARRMMRTGAKQIEGRAELKAMMPGRVVTILVKVGDEVQAGQGVITVEAMKMENELKSPKAGKVTEIKVAAGQTVEKGALLLVIE
jgi:biotin carboxyl carrier protein